MSVLLLRTGGGKGKGEENYFSIIFSGGKKNIHLQVMTYFIYGNKILTERMSYHVFILIPLEWCFDLGFL